MKRDDKQVIVRDAENKEHTFAAANVESRRSPRGCRSCPTGR